MLKLVKISLIMMLFSAIFVGVTHSSLLPCTLLGPTRKCIPFADCKIGETDFGFTWSGIFCDYGTICCLL
uniref:Putative secreted protein n=1 Tax=Nyssomyia neivai TaxID=330878 RepID=A0A1L8DNG7_9DIPT